MSDPYNRPWCSQCGVSFPMDKSVYEGLEKCGNTFYCPEGHPIFISQSSIVQKLRSEERSLEYVRKRFDKLSKALSSSWGVRTRMKNRLLSGACPFCNETPKDLSKHIRDKHAPAVA